MPDQTDIMNDALRALGLPAIGAPTDETERARQMRSAMPGVVKTCFESGAWNFAETIAQLPRLAVAPVAGYDYLYQLPGTFLRLNWISEFGDAERPLKDYTLRQGRIATSANVVYVAFVDGTWMTRYGDWPQTFADYVSAEMANRCAALLAPGEDRQRRLGVDAAKARKAAASFDAVQNPAERMASGSWSRARFGQRGRGEHMR